MEDKEEIMEEIYNMQFDYEIKFDEINQQIKKIKDNIDVWNLLSKYSIPYSYKNELIIIQKKLQYVKFKKYLDEYRNKSNIGSDIPYLYDLNDTKKLERIIFKNSTNLKNAKIFSDVSKELYWDIKPILSYYSISYLFSSFIGFIYNFKNTRGHHGISISPDENDPNNTEIKFAKSGLFQRIVKAFSYIFDYSIFSDYYICPKSKLCDTKEFFVIKNTNQFSISKSSFLLGDLIESVKKDKVNGFLSELTSKSSFSSFYSKEYFVKNSIVLKDYILIFVACNLARYNHYLWKNIYEGQSTDIFLHFQKAINNIDEVVNYLSDRFKNLDKLIRYL